MAETLGTFEQAVLLALVRLGHEAYGRAIFKDVQERLERDIAAGAVHATLERLQAKGLITSRLGPGTEIRAGRPRRYYRLSAAGVRALNDARETVDGLWRGIKWPLAKILSRLVWRSCCCLRSGSPPASLHPALRAGRTDPIVALRSE